MSLHLRAAPAAAADAVFFVIQRADGHWSQAAKIIGVFGSEAVAELAAAKQKRTYPHRTFGVAILQSEAREVANPIEIVRVKG